MRRWSMRAAALLLALLLPACGALAAQAEETPVPDATPASDAAAASTPGASAAASASPSPAPEALERSETVYVTATATGEVSSVLSSVYIVNPDGRAEITDTARLTDVHNVLANDSPEQQGDAYTFHADGDDVCYQGASADPLPFTMEVSYTLDGAPIDPEALAGRSGRVGIDITYENLLSNTVETDSGALTLYTPLSVITVITLNDGFSAVQCDNAHTLSEAGSVSVIGITFPGLAHNLDTDPVDELSNGLHLEADVTGFELDSIMAIVMPDIVDAKDLERVDDLRELLDGVDTLADSAGQLASGASSLSGGLGTLSDAVAEVSDGMASLAGEVSSAVAGLDAAQMQQELTASIDEAISLIDRLQGGSADAAADAVIAALGGALTPELEAQVRAAVKDAWNSQTGGAYDELAQIRSELVALKGQLSDIDRIVDLANQLNSGVQSLASAMEQIAGGMESSASGARSLASGLRRFCNEGMDELVESTEGIALALDRKDAMLALAEAYTSFSGDPAASTGSVRFIVTTDSVYVPRVTPAPSPEPVEEEPGFFARIWDWITGLFGG